MSTDSYIHFHQAPQADAPLVFTFHGTGGDEHQFPGLINRILPEAGIVSPRGDVSEYGAARFFKRTGEGVYDMADLAERTAKMPENAPSMSKKARMPSVVSGLMSRTRYAPSAQPAHAPANHTHS